MLERERFQCNFAQTRLFFRSLQCTPTTSIFNFLHIQKIITKFFGLFLENLLQLIMISANCIAILSK